MGGGISGGELTIDEARHFVSPVGEKVRQRPPPADKDLKKQFAPIFSSSEMGRLLARFKYLAKNKDSGSNEFERVYQEDTISLSTFKSMPEVCTNSILPLVAARLLRDNSVLVPIERAQHFEFTCTFVKKGYIGLTFETAADTNLPTVVVKKIKVKTQAAKYKDLRVGCRVLSVNNRRLPLQGQTKEMVLKAMKNAPRPFTILFCDPDREPYASRNAPSEEKKDDKGSKEGDGGADDSSAPVDMFLEAFRAHDRDGNGILSVEEVRAVFQELDSEVREREVDAMVQRFDVNGDGSIAYEEALSFIRALHIFHACDKDNSGFLTAEEVRTAVLKVDASASDARISNVVARADLNGDGQIRPLEAIQYMLFGSTHPNNVPGENDRLLNVNLDARVTRLNFCRIAALFSVKESYQKKIDALFAAFDRDGDGRLSEDDIEFALTYIFRASRVGKEKILAMVDGIFETLMDEQQLLDDEEDFVEREQFESLLSHVGFSDAMTIIF